MITTDKIVILSMCAFSLGKVPKIFQKVELFYIEEISKLGRYIQRSYPSFLIQGVHYRTKRVLVNYNKVRPLKSYRTREDSIFSRKAKNTLSSHLAHLVHPYPKNLCF